MSLRLWDWRAEDVVRILPDRGGVVREAAFNREGNLLVAGTDDGHVRVWDWRNERVVADLPTTENQTVYAVAFSRDGRYVVTGEGAGIRLSDGTVIPVARRTGIGPDAAVTLGIRPEHVVISDSGMLEAGVELVEPTGFGIILHLSLHGLPFKIFTLDREALSAGPKVRVDFPRQIGLGAVLPEQRGEPTKEAPEIRHAAVP